MKRATTGYTESVPRPIVVMILGHGRSGSSIVERTLGGEPGFTNIGELRDVFTWGVDRARCRCGLAVHECEFWRPIGDEALHGWTHEATDWLEPFFLDHLRYSDVPLLRRRLRRGTHAAQAARYAATFEALYRAIDARTDHDVIIDSSKHLGHLMCLAELADVDLRVLHLVRDPRGNAYSWKKKGVGLDAVGIPGHDLPSFSAWRTAIGWTIRNLLIEWYLPRRIPRVVVRYEDFADDPTGVIEHAVTRLGLEHRFTWAHVDGRIVTLPADHAFGGNPGVVARTTATVTPDDDWRTHLPANERRVVAALSAPMMRRYRYPFATSTGTTTREPDHVRS